MLKELEKSIGHTFKDKKLLQTALSHTSYVNENRRGEDSNERLEFLGDSILGMTTAYFLYVNFPNMPEGEMTKLRAELVCERSLARVGEALSLGKFIRLGKGEENGGGRSRPSIIADALEAIIAAVYLDGGREKATELITRHILSGVTGAGSVINCDYKTVLQEKVQRTKGNRISYRQLGETGPDHEKIFYVALYVNDEKYGEGSGKSKKEAEQQAAKDALNRFDD